MSAREHDDLAGRGSAVSPVRERIFQAAVQVFTERGYDRATMDDVAVQAGVARRTAFNHFPAKSDLAVEWAVRRSSQAVDVARRQIVGVERIRAYFHALAVQTKRDWEETRQLTTGLFRGFDGSAHRTSLPDDLVAWIAESGLGRPEPEAPHCPVEPRLVANVLYDVFQGALLRHLHLPGGRSRFVAEVDTVVQLVLAGCATAST